MKPRTRRIAGVTAGVIGLAALLDGLVIAFADRDDAEATSRRGVVQVDVKAPSTKPILRAEASAPTAAGATEFVRFWFDALNYSLANEDTDLLGHHANAGCSLCTNYLLSIAKWRDAGASLEGGYTAPLSLAIGPFSTQQPVTFAGDFLTSPATLKQADGSVQDYPGGRTRGTVTVLYANGQWQVTEAVIDSSKTPRTPQEQR